MVKFFNFTILKKSCSKVSILRDILEKSGANQRCPPKLIKRKIKLKSFVFQIFNQKNYCIITIKTEISAGLTPLMRDACPSVRGLSFDSLSLASIESEPIFW